MSAGELVTLQRRFAALLSLAKVLFGRRNAATEVAVSKDDPGQTLQTGKRTAGRVVDSMLECLASEYGHTGRLLPMYSAGGM